MKNIIKTPMFFAAAALGLGGCGPVVPSSPTWEHDIHPLMVARCIRCHDGNGHTDPLTTSAVPKSPAISAVFDFNYATFDELKASSGYNFLTRFGPAIVQGPMGAIPIMPPPPAETLEQWEIDMLSNWTKNPR